MAVAFDSTSSATTTGVPTSLSWTNTSVDGSPSCVGVGCGGYTVGGVSITSATYGGASMTRSIESLDGVSGRAPTIFSKLSPASGAQGVVVSCGAGFAIGAYALMVTGSDTSTAFSNTAANNGTSTTPTVTCTSATGELVMDANCTSTNAAPSVGAGQTQRLNSANDAVGTYQMGSTEDGAASVVMDWSVTSTSWRGVAASFKAAAAGGATGWGPLLSEERNRMVIS